VDPDDEAHAGRMGVGERGAWLRLVVEEQSRALKEQAERHEQVRRRARERREAMSRRVMQVELLWFAGCPNWQETDARLREAVAVAGVDAEVVLVEVTSPEDAERLRFRGSPTVLVDGRDPFAEESAPVGLSCRVFRTPQGLRGTPTVDQLVAVLRGDE